LANEDQLDRQLGHGETPRRPKDSIEWLINGSGGSYLLVMPGTTGLTGGCSHNWQLGCNPRPAEGADAARLP
jgi:hypothetical protein